MKHRAKMDQQGRITIPEEVSEASTLEPGGDRIVEFDYDTGSIILRPVVNPFDVLALDAIRQYRDGETKSLREIMEEMEISPEDNESG